MTIYDQLKRDEGLVLHPYHDSRGFLTWGYGHKIEPGETVPDNPTPEQAFEQLVADIGKAADRLNKGAPWAQDLDDARRGVLLNMTYNMGWGDGSHGLSAFHHTLAMVQAGNYDGAAEAMLESKWAKQVGNRAERLAEQMRSGIWQ